MLIFMAEENTRLNNAMDNASKNHTCVCPYCNKPVTEEHITRQCLNTATQEDVTFNLPPEDTHTKCTNYKDMLERPLIFTLEFEASNIPEHKVVTSASMLLAGQVPNSCGYAASNRDSTKQCHYFSFEGEDCELEVLKHMRGKAYRCLELMTHNEKMALTKKGEEDFQHATPCSICKSMFKPTDKQVRDHAHTTGTYRGAAHDMCSITTFLIDTFQLLYIVLRIRTLILLFKKRMN